MVFRSGFSAGLKLKSDQTDNICGGSSDDIGADSLMKEQHTPEDREDSHGALDDRYHIKGDHLNRTGVEIKADAGDKAEHQNSCKAADIRSDASQLSADNTGKQRREGQKGGDREDGQIAVYDFHAVRDHFLGQDVAAGAEAGKDEESGQQDIFLKK